MNGLSTKSAGVVHASVLETAVIGSVKLTSPFEETVATDTAISKKTGPGHVAVTEGKYRLLTIKELPLSTATTPGSPDHRWLQLGFGRPTRSVNEAPSFVEKPTPVPDCWRLVALGVHEVAKKPVASFQADSFGSLDMASLLPPASPSLANFRAAWDAGDFPIYYMNTLIVVLGTLAVQLVTISLAGYAFARLKFPGRDAFFYLFLLQLMIVPPVLILPNLKTVIALGIDNRLLGVMAPYFASAFGTFLMRQTFRSLPRDFEDAAEIDGASVENQAGLRHS